MSLSSVSPSLTLARSLPQPVEELSQMSAFDLFKSQMETGSTEAKVDSMKRLAVVAYAMGTDAVLKDLVPYLANVAMKQPPHEDELLLLLSSELRLLVPGLLQKQQVLPLLPILERLAAVEETVVRDEAVKGINHCVALLGHVSDSILLGMAKRLVGADWFTAKVSAAGILACLYKASPDPSEFVALYRELCFDETPMVRRSAAKHLGGFFGVLASRDKAQDLLQALQHLCKDEQDSVRLLAVASLAQVGPAYGKHPEWTAQYFLPLLKDGSTDLSWRVRNNLAKHFSDVAANLGIQGNSTYKNEQALVLACFASLLRDVEPEVRAAAVGHLARMVHWGGASLFQSHLHPLIPALADDVVMEVRSKCALALMEASQGGTLEDSVIVNSFGPLLESFLQDEFHEVQLQVLTNLHQMTRLLNEMSGVVQAILNMSKATNWRVREAVAKMLPHLAEARGVDFFATVLLEPAWLTLLLDPVASVRMACVHGMPILTKVAGQDWMIQNLFPQHVRIYGHATSSYLVRMTILQAHAEVAVEVKSGALWKDTVLQILRGLSDKVANVRMVAANGLARIVVDGDEAVVQAQICPALEKRAQEEEDEDCRLACTNALKHVGGR